MASALGAGTRYALIPVTANMVSADTDARTHAVACRGVRAGGGYIHTVILRAHLGDVLDAELVFRAVVARGDLQTLIRRYASAGKAGQIRIDIRNRPFRTRRRGRCTKGLVGIAACREHATSCPAFCRFIPSRFTNSRVTFHQTDIVLLTFWDRCAAAAIQRQLAVLI